MPFNRSCSILCLFLPFFGMTSQLQAADFGLDYTQTPAAWGGFYGGVHGSYGVGDANSTLNIIDSSPLFPTMPGALASPSGSTQRQGFLGGFQFGYNYQLDRIVIGPEIDVSFGNIVAQSALSSVGGAQNPAFAANQSPTIDRFSTLRQRVGFLATNSLLVYATGGLAVAGVHDATLLSYAGNIYSGSKSMTRAGWTMGVGAELAFAPRWRMKLEYLHYDFGDETVNGYRHDADPLHTQTDFTNAGDMIRIGVNYQLDDAANAEAGIDDAFSPLRGVTGSLGMRDWYSAGAMRYNLRNTADTALNSRLSYKNLHADSGEIFGRIDLPSGLFAKASLGAGAIGDGALTDEDFPPAVSSPSKTTSRQQNGALSYATGDIGYTVYKDRNFRIGPFIGFNYYHEQTNAYGCNQQNANSAVCAGISPYALAITENANWISSRIGAAAEVAVPWHGLKLGAEGAWLPYGQLYADDTHFLRLNTGASNSLSGPILQSGTVHGFQFEALLNLPISQSVDIGVGGRYWYFASHGASLFQAASGGSRQETDFSSRRYGEFVQISARF